jgi:hypothetical protein
MTNATLLPTEVGTTNLFFSQQNGQGLRNSDGFTYLNSRGFLSRFSLDFNCDLSQYSNSNLQHNNVSVQDDLVELRTANSSTNVNNFIQVNSATDNIIINTNNDLILPHLAAPATTELNLIIDDEGVVKTGTMSSTASPQNLQEVLAVDNETAGYDISVVHNESGVGNKIRFTGEVWYTELFRDIDSGGPSEDFKIRNSRVGSDSMTSNLIIESDGSGSSLTISNSGDGTFAELELNVAGINLNTNGSVIINSIPSYADDAAADADTTLLSGGLYKLNAGRAVYQKP